MDNITPHTQIKIAMEETNKAVSKAANILYEIVVDKDCLMNPCTRREFALEALEALDSLDIGRERASNRKDKLRSLHF